MPRSLTIEVRSRFLEGGRMSVAAGTSSVRERNRRRESVKKLIRAGHFNVIARLRAGEIHIGQLHDAVEADAIDRLRAVEPPDTPDITVQSVIDRLLKRTPPGGTYELRRVIGRALAAHFAPDRHLADIATEEIERLLFDPKVKGRNAPGGKVWSASRQEQARLVGSQLWQLAIASEAETAQRTGGTARITTDPWKAIKIANARAGHSKPSFLSTEQWLALEDANRDLPELALCALGALGGLREGEAAHLRSDVDVDMDLRLIRVQTRKGAFAWQPKTERSVRVVPMSDRLHGILARHLELGFAGVYFVHSSRSNGPLGKTGIRNWTMAAFARGGVPYGQSTSGLTNHSLRHSFASWLAQNDQQLLKIAELIGDTVETVARYYAHFLPRDHEKTVKILDTTLMEAV